MDVEWRRGVCVLASECRKFCRGQARNVFGKGQRKDVFGKGQRKEYVPFLTRVGT